MHNLQEKCGIFGVYGKGLDVSRLTFFGLFALQHRGQESSGIATTDGQKIDCYKNNGLVSSVYNEEIINSLKGYIAVGHNRYSTSKGGDFAHAQPTIIDSQNIPQNDIRDGVKINDGLMALAHNGNLPSVADLVSFLTEKKVPIDNLSDSELMAEAVGWHMKHGKDIEQAIIESYPLFTGAFSLVVMTKDSLVAVRDRCGIRPLCLAKLNGGYVVASETCAFQTVGAEFIREILPGEMVVINNKGMKFFQVCQPNPKLDIFEFIYFSRHDSELLGKLVYQVRKNFGVQLAKEFPVEADVVVPVPETAVPVAIGYSQALGIPLEMALAKNRYIHRTFIQPSQRSRDLGVKMKLNPLSEVLKGKRVVLIDDSIVRGTTSKQIVKILLEVGVKEVHFLVSSPPVKYPDFYGIDIAEQKDLIAFSKTVDEIKDFLSANSLHYLSLDGVIEAIGLSKDLFCTSLFTGEYPLDIKERINDFKKLSEG